MFLHNDIYCKHLIEALIKLRNILAQQEMYKTWAFREFVTGSRMELTQHRSHAPTMINLKFSRETSFVPMAYGNISFCTGGSFTVFSSACTESDDENHIL